MIKQLIITVAFFITIHVYGQTDFKFAAEINNENPIVHSAFELSYNSSYALPSWTGYKLTKNQIENTGMKVKEKYVPDPDVKIRAATKSDYKNSGYLMAQLIPYKDMLQSEEATEETFYMSNIVPQKLAFNNYIWQKLENLIREWVRAGETFYIVCGPVLTDAPFNTFSKNKISIPVRYYKIILDIENNRAIGFIFRNSMSSNSIQSFAVSVDEIEEITGIDFFPSLPDDMEKELEADKDTGNWNFEVLDE